jgi:hypothetical protein
MAVFCRDVLGGIPADYGGMLPLSTAAFNVLQQKQWAKEAVQVRKRSFLAIYI